MQIHRFTPATSTPRFGVTEPTQEEIEAAYVGLIERFGSIEMAETMRNSLRDQTFGFRDLGVRIALAKRYLKT